jgi:hypothetical protein
MNAKTRIPASFTQRLRELRRQLLGWTAVRGVSRWLTLIVGILLVDMIVDRMFSMDLIQRTILLVAMIAAAIGFFFWRVIRPLFMLPTDRALIYEIESKHPQLGESLLTATQLGALEGSDAGSANPKGVSNDLVAASIEKGFSQSADLDFGSVLNDGKRRSYLVRVALALLLLVGLGVGVLTSTFLGTWFNRNILLGDAQWPRQTYLQIAGVNDGLLQIPRGADHRQVVEITEDSRVSDVLVSLEIENGDTRMIQPMKSTGRSGGREHVFVFHNVSAPFRFRASGGDDVTPWVDVELVEPPALIDLQLTTTLPSYTAAQSQSLVGSGPHSILEGSSLNVAIETNKELSSAVLNHDSGQLVLQPVDESKKNFAITLTSEVPSDSDSQSANLDSGFVLRGGEYQFVLTDTSGLANVRKSKFGVSVKQDKPPTVRASLLGISGLVVPNAMLPTAFEAVDEYGLRSLRFASQWRTPDMTDADPPVSRDIAFTSNRLLESSPLSPLVSEIDEVEVLDLQPLGLTPGASLRFVVEAQDFQPSGEGIGRSSELLLRIVTPEELRADLLRREVEQRKAFLNARDQQVDMRGELEEWLAAWSENDSTESFAASQEAGLIRLLRDQKGLGTMVDRVASRFEEFLVEVKNNRIDESEAAAGIEPQNRLMARFDNGIIQPIRELDRDPIARATRQLDAVRLAVSAGENLDGAVAQSLAVQQEIVERMDKILAAMTSSEDYQEVVNTALELKADQQRLRKDIEKSLQPKDIFDEEGLEDVFDD